MFDGWFTIDTIDKRTFAISEYGHWEHVHCYLLIGRERAALIDTGLGIGDLRSVVNRLTLMNPIVLTTHVHWDHIGSHRQFASCFVHEREKDWLELGIPGLTTEQIRREAFRGITLPLPASARLWGYQPFKPTGVFQNGHTYELGGRKLVVMDTPGHSPGHVCFYDQSTGYLFSGDLIYTGAPIAAFYPTTSPEDLVRSFKKIAQMEKDVSKVFGGHNDLALDASILREAGEAAKKLMDHGWVRFGTGIHRFRRLSVRF